MSLRGGTASRWHVPLPAPPAAGPSCPVLCSWRTTPCSSRSGGFRLLTDRSCAAGVEGGECALASWGSIVCVGPFPPDERCKCSRWGQLRFEPQGTESSLPSLPPLHAWSRAESSVCLTELLVISYQTYHGCVISKFYDGVGGKNGEAVMGEEGIEEVAEDTPLWCASVQDEGGWCAAI